MRRGVEAGAEREGQLPTGGDVAGESLVGEHAVDRGARERLGGEQDVEVAVARGERVDEGAGPRAQVVLDHDVGRRPVVAGELEGVAATQLQVAALVDPASEGVDV